jgi:hypothetical protein
MRSLLTGIVAMALAGAAGCSGSGGGGAAEAPLVATGNERLVTLSLPGMT